MIDPAIVRAARDPSDIEAGLAYARAWKEDNRAFFDALYPPRPMRRRCQACGGRGVIVAGAGQ